MQITTVHKLQHTLDVFIKVLKFVWRHAFTFIVLGMLVAALLMYPAIDWGKFFVELIVAIGIDAAKMKMKLANANSNYHQSSSITSFTQANYWNSNIVGTSAYLSNLGRSE